MSENDKYVVFATISVDGVDEQKKQAGLYDPAILCEECERRFSSWDAHGFSVFGSLEGKPIHRTLEGFPCAYELAGDFRLLEFFVLSMLWRASVSSDSFFSNVSLGPYEEVLRRILLTADPHIPKAFSVMCIHNPDSLYPGAFFRPLRAKVNGVRYYRFYIPNVMFVIKVDSRPFPEEFQVIALNPKGPQLLVWMPFDGSIEANLFSKAKELARRHLLDKS